jgi:NAD(P)-dependent dehydrogenase (short-subunit alcohol dehydrogenase family)
MGTEGNGRVWFITGASSGFGRALADEALAAGDTVVGAGRSRQRLGEAFGASERFHPLQFDVTDIGRVPGVIDTILARFGRLDVLVNSAGRTQVGALEETTDEELRDLFELHFFGPAALTRAALPQMRAQGSGRVVQISSVGGRMTVPGFGAYSASKFALEGLTATLSREVDFGVRFLIVEPGAFRTGLFDPSAAHLSEQMLEYESTVGATRNYVQTGGGSQPGDPVKGARAIIAAIDSERPPLRLVLGEDALSAIREELRDQQAELDQWASAGSATTFDAAPTHGGSP